MSQLKVEEIAQAAHEVNRAYCFALGDESQLPWEEAPEWQKASLIAGVEAIIANPDTTPAESHAGWMAHKQAEGWVYGAVKDAETKEHPCMVPYEELPEAQRAKDHLFGATVRTLLSFGQEGVNAAPAVEEVSAAAAPEVKECGRTQAEIDGAQMCPQ